MAYSLTKNNLHYERNEKVLGGPATINKIEMFRTNKTPFCLTKANGARTWDVDNNEYLDYITGLGSIILGHNHPVVNEAVIEQLKNGISFSLPTPLESDVAEWLINHIPSAESVRFGKNGNDVTSAAVRLARYHTSKEHVFFTGYHGWQDWNMSQSAINGGILKCVGDKSHVVKYNDIEALEQTIHKYNDQIACLVIDPIPAIESGPAIDYLKEAREISTKNGIVLIFDEVFTGFRFHKAGVQAMVNVIPDLSCFSKAMGNGLPISTLVGKKDIMSKFTDVYYSMTAAGETLSLAATKAVLHFFNQHDVTGQINQSGKKLREGLIVLLAKHGFSSRIEVKGSNARFGIYFIDDGVSDQSQDRLYWTQCVCEEGILNSGAHIMSYAHTNEIVEETLSKYDSALRKMKEGINV